MPLVLAWLVGCSGTAPTPPEPAPIAAAPEPAPVVRGPVSFAPVSLPVDDKPRTQASFSATAEVDGASVPLTYQRLGAVGPDFGGGCNELDFFGLVSTGGKHWAFTHFECTPGKILVGEISAAADGALSLGTSAPANLDAVGGVWLPCAGMPTPWGTHLGSEEYEPDARREPTPDQKYIFANRRDMAASLTDPAAFDPYDYGYIPEVSVGADGAAQGVKHYAMGRFSHEVAYVLPDRRTVYLSDDGKAGGLYLFVADNPGDLSAGTLYAASWTPDPATAQGPLRWVSLGHATDAELARELERGVVFDRLMTSVDATPEATCPDGTRYYDHPDLKVDECVAPAPLPDGVAASAASRFETRRFAAWRGATLEFVKGEGITADAVNRRLYVALSATVGPMADDAGDVRLAYNPCGAVFGGNLAAGVNDTDGVPIASEFVAIDLGGDVVGTFDPESKKCSVEGIANPDNITFLSGRGPLVIAEDTSLHDAAALWAFDPGSRALTRIGVAPQYAEFTGVHWIPDLAGRGYLTVTLQHPWGEDFEGGLPEGVTEPDRRSFTGVLGPFPKLD